MSPERSVRQQALISFVTEELEGFNRGEVGKLLPTRELAEKFGYSINFGGNNVTSILREKIPLLYQERKSLLKPQRKEVELPTPSSELAWILGAMSGAGHAADPRQSKECQVHFATIDKEFAERFHFLSKQVFKLDVSVRQTQSGKTSTTTHRVAINSREVHEFFGHISRTTWPATVRQSHVWILTRDEYIKGFLSGFFDARGLVTLHRISSGHAIRFNTSYQNVAFFVSNMLARIGINTSTMARRGDNRITGVMISNYPDIIKLAQNIHSSIPDKEERLLFYRNFVPLRTLNRPISAEEVIVEYRRVRELIVQQKGRLPSCGDIHTLRELGMTRFSYEVYSRRFSINGSFFEARATLERLLTERQLISAENVYTPRPHKYADEDLIKEYRRIRELSLRERARIPTRNFILRLRRNSNTEYGADAYISHFGGPDGLFEIAIRSLESKIKEDKGD